MAKRDTDQERCMNLQEENMGEKERDGKGEKASVRKGREDALESFLMSFLSTSLLPLLITYFYEII